MFCCVCFYQSPLCRQCVLVLWTSCLISKSKIKYVDLKAAAEHRKLIRPFLYVFILLQCSAKLHLLRIVCIIKLSISRSLLTILENKSSGSDNNFAVCPNPCKNSADAHIYSLTQSNLIWNTRKF